MMSRADFKTRNVIPAKAGISLFQFSCFFLMLTPAVSWAWTPFAYDRGNLKYEKNEFEASSQFYRQALESSPHHPKVHYNLGDSLYRNGRFEEAREEFLAALKSDDRALREKALYNLGDTQFRLGDLQGAIDSYEQALGLNKDNRKAELNRDYVKKLLEEKKQEEQKQEQKPQEEKKEQNQDQDKEKEETQKEEQKGQEEEKQKKEGEKTGDQKTKAQESKGEEEIKPTPKMSQDEGEALLDSLEDDRSGAIREMVERHTKKKETEIEKDW